MNVPPGWLSQPQAGVNLSSPGRCARSRGLCRQTGPGHGNLQTCLFNKSKPPGRSLGQGRPGCSEPAPLREPVMSILQLASPTRDPPAGGAPAGGPESWNPSPGLGATRSPRPVLTAEVAEVPPRPPRPFRWSASRPAPPRPRGAGAVPTSEGA